MPLSNHAAVINNGVEAITAAGAKMRHVRDATGDLLWRDIDAVQDALREAKTWTFRAIAEIERGEAQAEAYMASLGGPASLAQLMAKAAACEAAAVAWNNALADWINDLPSADLMRMVTVSTDGISTRHREVPPFVAAVQAAPLRASAALAGLIAAFEDVGA